MATKAELWDQWIDETLIVDITAEGTPDPVPFFDENAGDLETSEALSKYKWGLNDGEYLYLVYLLDEPVQSAHDITPVYVGESANISSRIGQHSRKIREALPITDWEDDGAWGSFSKYDHIAAIREATLKSLYVWICDVEELAAGPYGHETYRQELEAKLVGLVHGQDRFNRVFANREFVPNQILHAIGKAGTEWVSDSDAGTVSPGDNESPSSPDLQTDLSKTEQWQTWADEYILDDVRADSTADPISLFDVDEKGTVSLTENGRLKRSATIDERIRQEGLKCIDDTGTPHPENEGLLYVMYQLADDGPDISPADVVPRYIGKAEVYGKKRELSSNFVEIANERNATRSFARWGDGDYWHVGELSMAIHGEDERKVHWADALFEPGMRRLREDTYLWVRAWDPDADLGPYGVPAFLAEVEPQLIGLAYDAFPDQLLNKEGTPDDAAIHTADSAFKPASR